MRTASVKLALVLGLGLTLAPSLAWASYCTPMISNASSYSIADVAVSYVVGFRIPAGCPPEVSLSVVGLPAQAELDIRYFSGEAYATVRIPTFPERATTFHVTYTATSSSPEGGTTTVTLPLRVNQGPANETPRLDPVTDLVVRGGEIVSFTVGLTDFDRNLEVSLDTLTISGLPRGSQQQFLEVSQERIVIQVTLAAEPASRGLYRVAIHGRDARGDSTLAHMRILIP